LSAIVQDLIAREIAPPIKDSAEFADLVKTVTDELGHAICATPRRNRLKPWVNGFPCERAPMFNGRCQKHGGKLPAAGPEHHLFKHGKYSKAMGNTSMQELYEKARRDPELLGLTEEIALLSARMQDTMSRLNRKDSRSVWEKALRKTAHAMKTISKPSNRETVAVLRARVEQAQILMADLVALFQLGGEEYKVWEEWFSGVELMRKLVDTERKHREAEALNISAEKMMIVTSLIGQAAQNVLSAEDAGKLRAEIVRLRMATYGNGLALQGRDLSRLSA
jgi:hypothetical protein